MCVSSNRPRASGSSETHHTLSLGPSISIIIIVFIVFIFERDTPENSSLSPKEKTSCRSSETRCESSGYDTQIERRGLSAEEGDHRGMEVVEAVGVESGLRTTQTSSVASFLQETLVSTQFFELGKIDQSSQEPRDRATRFNSGSFSSKTASRQSQNSTQVPTGHAGFRPRVARRRRRKVSTPVSKFNGIFNGTDTGIWRRVARRRRRAPRDAWRTFEK